MEVEIDFLESSVCILRQFLEKLGSTLDAPNNDLGQS